MATYYDRLNAFFHESAKKSLKPEFQLVMLHLLHYNNQRGNTDKFYLTDGRLMRDTHLSQRQVTEAKRHLKNIGLIDFRTNPKAPREGTLYILPALSKTVQPKPASEYLSVNSEAVRKTWRECAGENLTGGAAFGMIELENIYGTQTVVDAIIRADQSNTAPRLTFNFVKAVLENRGGSKRNGNYRNATYARREARSADAAGRPVGGNDEFDTDIPPEYRKYLADA